MKTTIALAVLLLSVLAAGCVSKPPVRRSVQFGEELSRQIELMLREHDRIEERRRLRDASRMDAKRHGSAGTPEPGVAALVLPVAVLDHAGLRDTFGEARSGGRGHEGIDIFAPRGTAVFASAAGVIEFIADKPRPGRCVGIAGSDDHSYFYAHLDRWAPGLYEGMPVRAGDLVGFVGNTGNASGGSPHLHFEVRRSGVALNPYPILRRAAVVASDEIPAGK